MTTWRLASPTSGLVDEAGADGVRGAARATAELCSAAVGVGAFELRGPPLAADRLGGDDTKMDVVARRQRQPPHSNPRCPDPDAS